MTIVREVDHYEDVLWFSDMPQEADCRSGAWADGLTARDALLEVRKQAFEPAPKLPEILVPWVDDQEIRRASRQMPPLRERIPVPAGDAEHGEGDTPPLWRSLADHPDVQAAYDRYRPCWESWAEEHLRREAIQRVYADLFRLRTQVLKQGEVVEVVLGLGLLQWRAELPIRRHVVVANVELKFDADAGVIRVEPPGEGARLRIEDEMLDAERRPDRSDHVTVETLLDETDDEVWDKDLMHRALRTWTQALRANARWSEDVSVPAHVGGAGPVVSFSPALILRKRTQIGMRRIYDALIEQLSDDATAAPTGWQGLVEDIGIGVDPVQPTPEVYSPLPTNREQRQIVDAINRQRGVLVQGPPGTGKSHTIANLICHLLATGKRVLVTAETPQALRVIKDKLPDKLKALCVSLLGQGGDAFAELNRAIQGITKQASSPGAGDRTPDEIERDLENARRCMDEADSKLRRIRAEETDDHSIADGTYRGTASAIARRVACERERFEWLRLPDRTDCAGSSAPLSNQEMTAWLDIVRRSHGQDTRSARPDLRIPHSVELVAPADFATLVSAENSAATSVDRSQDARVHPAYRPLQHLDPDRRAEIADRLRRLEDRRRMLEVDRDPWLPRVIRDTVAGRPGRWDGIIASSRELLGRIESLYDHVKERVVVIPSGRDRRNVRADVETALAHLEAGGRWKRFGLFTPRSLRGIDYLGDEVRVDGTGAADSRRLRVVLDYLTMEFAQDDLQAIWSRVGASPLPGEPRQSLAVAAELCSVLENTLSYADECRVLAGAMAAMPSRIPAPDWSNGEAATWLALIDAAAVGDRYHQAARKVSEAAEAMTSVHGRHDAHPVVAALADAVRRRDVGSYGKGYAEVISIEALREDARKRRWIEDRLEPAVPGLPHCLASTAQDASWNDRFGAWEDAWRWAIADTWLRKRCDPSHQKKLEQLRTATEAKVRDLLTESVVLRAWEHFFSRLSDRQAAALRGWREAVRAMGKGTGRSSRLARLRRQAREYMDECRDAIPVWIMPRYLVAEMMNPKPELYDLVIVDEASQLGVDSAFLFYIAGRMVVVGDDQQISPYGIGIPDDTIADLQQRYLDGIPHHNAFAPQSSLYGNAYIRFGGRNVVLREHFRCMPEIIQFSNDLCYEPNGTALDPLRTYTDDRLEPLLVRRVSDGYRTGGEQARNPPEADAIVEQVAACIADPRYADATMGVISLQGEAQARLIEKKLLERVDPGDIEQRRLVCGDAYAFQGDERDVMFLSMVAAETDDRGEPQRIGTLAHDSDRQRFNVAASRARDQMWLFHTVDINSLSNRCIRRRLLSYMCDPSRQTAAEHEEQFESAFEREVFQRITDRGYRVRTQVGVGDATTHRYRIDLVVAGRQSRLAVECDGDRWHGMERYEKDMARQRDLERAGWQFVRIRGGDFYRDPDRALEPLWTKLEHMGISPCTGDKTVDKTASVRRRTSVADHDENEHSTPIHAPSHRRPQPASAPQGYRHPGLDEQDGAVSRRPENLATALPTPAEYETEELAWDDVATFFEEYGCVMMDHPEMRWYQESWGALIRWGLASGTRFEDDEHAQVVLKLRSICLMAMYLGIYQQEPKGPMLDGYFSGHPGIREYVHSLNIDDDVLWEMARLEGLAPADGDDDEEYEISEEEDEDEKAEIVRDAVMELLKAENDSIYGALGAHYGGTVGLFVSLWNSRMPLHEVDPHEDVVNAAPANVDLEYLLTSPEMGEKATVYAYVEGGMRNWELDSPW